MRIRRAGGEIAGAGVLVAVDLVLTCARILTDADPYTVEFVLPDPAARVMVAAHVDGDALEAGNDGAAGRPGSGVALLRLAAPRPAGHPATLRRTAVVRRAVRVHGASGTELKAEVMPGAGGDGRVPLRRADRTRWFGARWQGAGVIDEATGGVVGIALGDERGAPYLVPVETVLRHLPRLAEHTSGLPAVPGALLARTRTRALDATAVKWFTAWSSGRGRPVVVGVVPESDATASATLRACLTLADREHHTTLPAGHPLLGADSGLPPVGGVDLALDAAGLTADRVAELIAERLGLAAIAGPGAARRLSAAGPPPLRCVVLGVDRSAQPGALLELLGSLTDGGSRLLLIFRGQGAETRRAAAADLPVRAWRAQRAVIRERLADIAFLARTELHDRVARVKADTGPAGAALTRASSVRAFLAELPDPPPGATHPEDLGPYERRAEASWHRVDEAIDELDQLIAERNELRGTLDAHRAHDLRTAGHEDRESARLYLVAHDMLYTGSCDVAAAQRAVSRYTAHVDARPGTPTPAEGTEDD